MTNTLVFAALALLALLTVGLIAYRKWEPSSWYIGPRINGTNSSKGLPLFPHKLKGYEWVIELTNPKQELDYVTRSCKSLEGVKQIRVKARVTGRFYQAEAPEFPPAVSIVIQHKDDDWSGKPYRWYLPYVILLDEEGVHDITINLDDPAWVSVLGTPDASIHQTIDNVGRIGLTFGGNNGLGHGVRTNTTAKFELYNFELIR